MSELGIACERGVHIAYKDRSSLGGDMLHIYF